MDADEDPAQLVDANREVPTAIPASQTPSGSRSSTAPVLSRSVVEPGKHALRARSPSTILIVAVSEELLGDASSDRAIAVSTNRPFCVVELITSCTRTSLRSRSGPGLSILKAAITSAALRTETVSRRSALARVPRMRKAPSIDDVTPADRGVDVWLAVGLAVRTFSVGDEAGPPSSLVAILNNAPTAARIPATMSAAMTADHSGCLLTVCQSELACVGLPTAAGGLAAAAVAGRMSGGESDGLASANGSSACAGESLCGPRSCTRCLIHAENAAGVRLRSLVVRRPSRPTRRRWWTAVGKSVSAGYGCESAASSSESINRFHRRVVGARRRKSIAGVDERLLVCAPRAVDDQIPGTRELDGEVVDQGDMDPELLDASLMDRLSVGEPVPLRHPVVIVAELHLVVENQKQVLQHARGIHDGRLDVRARIARLRRHPREQVVQVRGVLLMDARRRLQQAVDHAIPAVQVDPVDEFDPKPNIRGVGCDACRRHYACLTHGAAAPDCVR